MFFYIYEKKRKRGVFLSPCHRCFLLNILFVYLIMEKIKTESREQSEVFLYFWNNYPYTRRLIFHIPNGGKRTKREAVKFKAMGVVKGIPDIFVAIPSSGFYGFFVEMKKKGEFVKKGSDQYKCAEALKSQGYKVDYYDNSEDAIEAIKNYLSKINLISDL